MSKVRHLKVYIFLFNRRKSPYRFGSCMDYTYKKMKKQIIQNDSQD